MSSNPTAHVPKYRSKSPALHFALAAVIALIIFSFWLHFLFALQIESLGRDIDSATEKLEQLQRANLARMRQITFLESQRRMAGQAATMGFLPQQPLYLAVDQPLAGQSTPAEQSAFLTIWSVNVGREAASAPPAAKVPGEPAGAATSVANLP